MRPLGLHLVNLLPEATPTPRLPPHHRPPRERPRRPLTRLPLRLLYQPPVSLVAQPFRHPCL